MNLEDLRKNNWNPRGGEKGPKTIEEVREEVEKEQQENELERIEVGRMT
jgi:translation initiation factor 4G